MFKLHVILVGIKEFLQLTIYFFEEIHQIYQRLNISAQIYGFSDNLKQLGNLLSREFPKKTWLQYFIEGNSVRFIKNND